MRLVICLSIILSASLALAADPVPIDFDRLKADSKAQHKELLAWELADLAKFKRRIELLKKAKVDKSIPAAQHENTAGNDGVKTLELGNQTKWVGVGRETKLATVEAKRSWIEHETMRRTDCKARIAEARAGKRQFIPFLRPPFVVGQVGRIEEAAYRVSGDATTATVNLKSRREPFTEYEAKLIGLNFDWPTEAKFLSFDANHHVYQYVGETTWLRLPIFERLDSTRAYEAFRTLNGDGLLP